MENRWVVVLKKLILYDGGGRAREKNTHIYIYIYIYIYIISYVICFEEKWSRIRGSRVTKVLYYTQ